MKCRRNAIRAARKVINIASTKNCIMMAICSEPSVFLIPTSLALLADLAVARFIKLIQAMIKMSILRNVPTDTSD